MKQQLLSVFALILVSNAYSQNTLTRDKASSSFDIIAYKKKVLESALKESERKVTVQIPIDPLNNVKAPLLPLVSKPSAPPSNINWNLLCGSMNNPSGADRRNKPLKIPRDLTLTS